MQQTSTEPELLSLRMTAKMSRKRIVVALLLVVTLGLGAAGYLVTRTKGSEVALSTPEAPIDISEIQPADEIGVSTSEELLKLAALTRSKSTSTDADDQAAATPVDEAAAAEEESTVAMESVDTPTTSIVMANSTESEASESDSPSLVRLANIPRGATSARSGGSPSTGGTPPGSPPPSGAGPSPADSQNPGDANPPPNEALQNNGEGEGTPEGPGGGDIIDPPYEGNPVEPPYQFEPLPGEEPVSVPEPGTLILLGAGLAALGYGRRRLKQQ
jgi:hypothetical protein